MFNILVTDDEQIVIDSLSFIINKNFENVAKVHTALSGTEAIESIMKNNIDIIFMDINMPGISGLETADCIKKLKPNIVIIILSAFDQFEYAQEAMNVGAFKYITKPVNRNLVIETVRGAMDLVEKNKGIAKADEALHQKLDMVSPMVENDFIYSCIFNKDKAMDLDSYLDYFNLGENPWVFCCFEFPNINSENQYKTYLKIHDLLNEDFRCLVSSFMMNRIVVYFPLFSQNPDESEMQEQIKKIYTKLSYNISAGIRTGVSKITKDRKLLQSSYNDALSALNKVGENGGIIFSGSEMSENRKVQNNSSEFKNQIINKLLLADLNSVKTFLDLYISELISADYPLDKIKNSLFELMATANNSTKTVVKDFYCENFDNAFSVLSQENDISMLKEFVQKILSECAGAIQGTKLQTENPTIKKVCDYIDLHIAEDISLEQMADYVSVSSFYLSKLFKDEKGVTFINFISDKRLEKARQLLSETNESIKEITAEIGYNDQNYFSRIFKSKYGLSPKEYRQIN